MFYPIDLTEAARILEAACGPRVAASRRGGRQQFAAVLCQRFGMAEVEATRIVTALEQRQVLRWVPAHGPLQPCPGMLELWGTWRLQARRLEGPAAA